MPMGKAARVIISGRFKRCTTSFRVAGVALCDIPRRLKWQVTPGVGIEVVVGWC